MSEPSGADEADVAAATAARDQDLADIREAAESFARWWLAARQAGVPRLAALIGVAQWHAYWLSESDDE